MTKPLSERSKEICRAWRQGETAQQIAARLGIKPSDAWRVIRREQSRPTGRMSYLYEASRLELREAIRSARTQMRMRGAV